MHNYFIKLPLKLKDLVQPRAHDASTLSGFERAEAVIAELMFYI